LWHERWQPTQTGHDVNPREARPARSPFAARPPNSITLVKQGQGSDDMDTTTHDPGPHDALYSDMAWCLTACTGATHDGLPALVEAQAPTDDELSARLQTVITRHMKMLTRQGVLMEGMGPTDVAEPDADGDEAPALRPLQAAAVTDCAAASPARRCRTTRCKSTPPGS